MSYADDEAGDPGRPTPLSSLLRKAPGAALRKASQRPDSDTCRRRSSPKPKPGNNRDVRQLANWRTERSLSTPWMPSSQPKGQTTVLSSGDEP
ncbi:hypothetical protein CapIbe_010633 [Capra ibex]